jgi:F-type H+-transporting ATPase subunit gamma
VIDDYSGLYDAPSFLVAQELAETMVKGYLAEQYDRVDVSRPHFVNTMTQQWIVEPLLPLAPEAMPQFEGASADVYTIEPNVTEMATRLLSAYIATYIHRALLEAACSEFAARMVAMDLATTNAEDMIQRLTLDYNRARQTSITEELIDIIGGAEGLR